MVPWKKRFGIALLTFIAIASGFMNCSKDPASPSNNDEQKPIASAIIGSSGGRIETENAALSIPPGAFHAENTIEFFDNENDDAFADDSAAPSFRIVGLPDDYSKPLKIRVKYEGELSGDSYIAAGGRQFDDVSGDTVFVYDVHAAADSAGYLIAELPAATTANLDKSGGKTSAYDIEFQKIIYTITRTAQLRTEHFLITYPITLSPTKSSVGQSLEQAFAFVSHELGFTEIGSRLINVIITNQPKPAYSNSSRYYLTLNISRDLVARSQFAVIKSGVGLQLLRRAISDQIKKSPIKDGKMEDYVWLAAAVFAWAADYLIDDPGVTYPFDFAANAMAPFNGIRAGAGIVSDWQKVMSHGYGLSALIKYLVQSEFFGKNGIGKTYSDIGKGINPTTALIANVDAFFIDWWPDFFKQYINGEIYDRSIGYFLDNASPTWTIDDANDTLKVFTPGETGVGLYPDLSARLFKINLSIRPAAAGDKLTMRMIGVGNNDGLALVVFGVKGSQAIYLETAYAQDFEIPDLQSYYDDGVRQFLAVLVNSRGSAPYTGSWDIDFSIRAGTSKAGPTELDYTQCVVEVVVVAETENNRFGEVQHESELTSFSSAKMIGRFSGTTFTSDMDDGFGTQAHLSITLNDAHNKVLECHWTHINEHKDLGLKETKQFFVTNVPVRTGENSKFEIRGPAACEEIQHLSLDWTWGDQYIILTGHSCDANSYIFLSFRKD